MAEIGIPVSCSFQVEGTAQREEIQEESFTWNGAHVVFNGAMTIAEFKNAFVLDQGIAPKDNDAKADLHVSMVSDAGKKRAFMAALIRELAGGAKYASGTLPGGFELPITASSTLQKYLESWAQSQIDADLAANGISADMEAEHVKNLAINGFEESASGGVTSLWTAMSVANRSDKLDIIARQLPASRYLPLDTAVANMTALRLEATTKAAAAATAAAALATAKNLAALKAQAKVIADAAAVAALAEKNAAGDAADAARIEAAKSGATDATIAAKVAAELAETNAHVLAVTAASAAAAAKLAADTAVGGALGLAVAAVPAVPAVPASNGVAAVPAKEAVPAVPASGLTKADADAATALDALKAAEAFKSELPVLAGDKITFRFNIDGAFTVSSTYAAATNPSTSSDAVIVNGISQPGVGFDVQSSSSGSYGVPVRAVNLVLTLAADAPAPL
jgi:hypothetical protein